MAAAQQDRIAHRRSMVPTTIALSHGQRDRLKELAQYQGCSLSAAIRDVIDIGLQRGMPCANEISMAPISRDDIVWIPIGTATQ